MLTSIAVANAILRRAKRDGVKLNPKKLQRLVYIVYKTYLKQTGIPLFGERFEAWKYGPVVRNVYIATRKFSEKGKVDYLTEVDKAIYTADEESSPVFTKIADAVWAKYGLYDTEVLSKLTKGTAWQKAIEEKRDLISDADIIEEANIG